MAPKDQSRDQEYRLREDNARSRQTGNGIDARNNPTSSNDPQANEPNVEQASNEGIGDAALNDSKLTNHTSNHSADA